MRKDHPTVPGDMKAFSKGSAFSSIQGRIVGLLLLVLVPILISQAYFSYDRYQFRKRVESSANLELARATAKSFDTFVQDVLHQELAIGLAFTSSQTLSDKERSRILSDNHAGNPAIWHFFWDNPAGLVTAATGSQFIGMDISDREFYREIVAGKDWVVSDLLLSRTTRQPSFTISRGIRNEQGELLGIIVAGILPAKLDRVLAVERPGDAGVSLLDSKGMHVYRYPATQYSWERRNWLNLYPFLEEVLKGKEVVISDHQSKIQKGRKRIVAFTPVPSIGWIASCSRAEKEVVGPIISNTLQVTGIILLVALASFLVAVAQARTISSSVKTLRNHALSLGQGGTQSPLTIGGPAEIKDLAEAFNKMSEEIRFREKALRESEERLALAASATEIGMYDWDLVSDTILWTQTHEAIFGYAPAATTTTPTTITTEHPYHRWADRIHPEDLPLVEEESRRCMRDRKPLELQYRIIWPDGSLHWVETRGIFQYGTDDIACRMLGVVMDITDRKQTEEQLHKSLAEKEVMLREIHHRVKNNLQVISSLISLQADTLTDDRIRDELNDVRDRVHSMALVHEKLYQTNDLAKLDFAEYAASLTQTLWRSHSALAQNVKLNLNAVEPILMSVETAVPCGLILNELAGNALKHAFPNNSSGEVELGLKLDPATGIVRLRIRDNGVGLPADFDWRHSESLGLRLVKILAGQLRGTLETATGPGAEFKIIFPLKENKQ